MPKRITKPLIVVTGSESGLGRQFLIHYASQDPSQELIAIDRTATTIPDEISNPSRIRLVNLDVSDQQGIASLAHNLRGTPIGLVIHCAGVRGLVGSVVASQPGDVAAAETLDVMDAPTMLDAFSINCIGTLLLLRGLVPNLVQCSREMGVVARAVVLGSRMGSVSANGTGGGYAYRASKAGLNAVIKSMSVDVREVAFLILHPGRVETGLVEWKEEGAVSAMESVADCVRVIEQMSLERSGSYVDRYGTEIQW